MLRRALVGLSLVALFALPLVTAPEAIRERLEARDDYDHEGGRKGAHEEAEEEEEGHRFDEPNAFFAYHEAIRRPDLPGAGVEGYEVGYSVRALAAADAAALGKGGQAALPWQEHGPSNVAGRARAFLVDVRDATRNTWFIGSAGGGIWKTTNGGLRWTNASADLPNLSVSTLAQSAAAPDVLYAGTGEGMRNIDAIFGAGIFKSSDGGATWALLPATATGDFRAVNRLVVSPTDANLLVAATTSGLFRSTDGGASWAFRVGGTFQQVVATPDFSALYATTTQGDCTAAGIFRSTDAGLTWTLANSGAPASLRVELAVAPSQPSRVYASIEGCDDLSHLALTNDGGDTWREVTVSPSSARQWLSAQGWYDNAIAVSPFNPDQIYLGGLDLYRGSVGGATGAIPAASLTRATVWSANASSTTYAHADHHSYTPIVTNAAAQSWKLLITTDGGAFESGNPTAGTMQWTARNTGLNTTQFYGADKMPGGLTFVAGAQDNGSYTSTLGPIATSAWTRRVGGDGFDVVYATPTDFVASLYNDRLVRIQNGVKEEITAFADAGSGPFITQIGKVDGDPARLYVTGPSGVWRSDDFGDTWTLGVFRNRTRGAFDRWGYSSGRVPVAVSPADARIVWAGARMSSGERRLFVSRDGGATFDTTALSREIYNLSANATACPDLASARCGAAVTGLAGHPTQPNTAYALFSVQGYAKVLRTTDLGRTWHNLSGTFATPDAVRSSNGFPNVAVYSLLAFPYAPERLWAGTEIGLFVSEDGGASWTKDTSGLPPVALWQMRMVDGRVVIATHGRGVWSVDLPDDYRGYRPAGYQPPTLRAAVQRPDGHLLVQGAVRSDVDSLQVRVNGSVVRRDGPLAGGTSVALDLPANAVAAGEAEVQIVGYSGGEVYSSGIQVVPLLPLRAPAETLSLDFSDLSAVSLSGLMGGQPGGFASEGLHTPHPYADASTYSATVLQPIRIASAGTTIHFRSVALVEPCNDGSSYCLGGGLYDYAVLEASPDGVTWTTLTGPLSALSQPAWLSAFNANGAGSEALMVEHVVIPSRQFAVGTTLLLRFRLASDESVHGWGWALDDVRVDAAITAADAAPALGAVSLGLPFPNPARTRSTVALTLPTPAAVTVRVYDVQGRLVVTLADGMLPAGRHTLDFDAAGVAAGVYLVRLESGGAVQTRSLTVTR